MMFSKRLKELLSTETEIDDAALISIDSKGVDIRVREGAQVATLYSKYSLIVLLLFLSLLLVVPFNLVCSGH